jgi:hypothetical protein
VKKDMKFNMEKSFGIMVETLKDAFTEVTRTRPSGEFRREVKIPSEILLKDFISPGIDGKIVGARYDFSTDAVCLAMLVSSRPDSRLTGEEK